MSISDIGYGQHGRAPIRRKLRWARQCAGVGLIVACLALLPADIRLTSDFGFVGVGVAEAIAQGRGNGNGNERSAPSDRDVDRGGGRDRDRGDGGNDGNDKDQGNDGRDGRDDRDRGNGGNGRDDPGSRGGSNGGGASGGNIGNGGNGRATRGISVPNPTGTPDNPSIAPALSRPAAPARSIPVERAGPTGHAPTEAGTARTRAMVEIAKELGANAPNPTEHAPISGPVTQEMLDVAEEAYVAAVQEAWEAHGFPWADPDVLRSLGALEALVLSLETIMASTAPGPVSRPDSTVAPDINNDGFVDINDLWDAHQR